MCRKSSPSLVQLSHRDMSWRQDQRTLSDYPLRLNYRVVREEILTCATRACKILIHPRARNPFHTSEDVWFQNCVTNGKRVPQQSHEWLYWKSCHDFIRTLIYPRRDMKKRLYPIRVGKQMRDIRSSADDKIMIRAVYIRTIRMHVRTSIRYICTANCASLIMCPASMHMHAWKKLCRYLQFFIIIIGHRLHTASYAYMLSSLCIHITIICF